MQTFTPRFSLVAVTMIILHLYHSSLKRYCVIAKLNYTASNCEVSRVTCLSCDRIVNAVLVTEVITAVVLSRICLPSYYKPEILFGSSDAHDDGHVILFSERERKNKREKKGRGLVALMHCMYAERLLLYHEEQCILCSRSSGYRQGDATGYWVKLCCALEKQSIFPC
ncbi:hypothetical protein EDB82DRAFT_508901 [Fusarium venenatum]|uniref:uncharacterized protein n=1 Tax=Fusarium venenatum TaxID=56646 RepID=UPI001DB14BD1|nr:hypothetical protein EDB82DRAFT_508901 [Fusarium venenatum]